jgi:NAD(P)-dependent dehydrogenase (short-subunit alcohol dehydrogenase family)
VSAALLRPGLLAGLRIVVAGARGPGHHGEPDPAGPAAAAAQACRDLGADVASVELDLHAGEAPAEELAADAVAGALADEDRVDLALIDAGSMFAAGPTGAPVLALAMQVTWDVSRALAEQSFLKHAPAQGGLLVLLAPPPRAGEHADGARAGLENLARTLSIEWARFGTRTVAIAPGDATSAAETAELVAYLASPAGAYFSGCLLDLRGGA